MEGNDLDEMGLMRVLRLSGSKRRRAFVQSYGLITLLVALSMMGGMAASPAEPGQASAIRTSW
jgi:hypothetical protein